MRIGLVHGLGTNPLTLYPLKLFLKRKFPDVEIVVPWYKTSGIKTDAELVDRVDTCLSNLIPDKSDPLVLVGQSLGGIAVMNLHTRGWNVVKAVSVGAPLHGASVLNKLARVLPWWFDRGTYTYLRTKGHQMPPPHPYATISMGILSTDFDNCVYRHEATMAEEHHHHEEWLDHRLGFFHPRLWRAVFDNIRESV